MNIGYVSIEKVEKMYDNRSKIIGGLLAYIDMVLLL